MSAFRLLALDVDGTLVGAGPDTVRPAVIGALRAAHAAGLHVVLATGRGPRMVRHIVAQVSLPMGLVLANGALIYEDLDAAPMEHRLLPPEVGREAIDLYRRADLEPIVFDDPLRSEMVYYEREHASLARWLPANAFRSERVRDLRAWLQRGALMIGVFGDEAHLKAVAASLAERLDGRASVQPLFHPKYDQWTLDVFAPGCTKWQGLQRYAARHGVAADEILAIGDGLNDLPMLLGAGLGVAMGNSDPEVLDVAGAVVGTFEEDGVAEAVERFIRAPAGPRGQEP